MNINKLFKIIQAIINLFKIILKFHKIQINKTDLPFIIDLDKEKLQKKKKVKKLY